MNTTYRVIYYDRKTKKNEFMWQIYTTYERAQHAADTMNSKSKTAKAQVAVFRGALRIK